MLAGDFKSSQPTTQYAVNTLRSAFFASIEQFIFLTPLHLEKPAGSPLGVGCDDPLRYCCYNLFAPEIDSWNSLKSPQTTVMAFPTVSLPSRTSLSRRDVSAWFLNVPVPLSGEKISKVEKDSYTALFIVLVSTSFHSDGDVTGRRLRHAG